MPRPKIYACGWCGVQAYGSWLGRLPPGWMVERRGRRVRKPRDPQRGTPICEPCNDREPLV